MWSREILVKDLWGVGCVGTHDELQSNASKSASENLMPVHPQHKNDSATDVQDGSP